MRTEGIKIEKFLLNLKEVAGILGVCKLTVYRMVWDGNIQATRIRGSIRVFGDSLEKYVNGNIIGG